MELSGARYAREPCAKGEQIRLMREKKKGCVYIDRQHDRHQHHILLPGNVAAARLTDETLSVLSFLYRETAPAQSQISIALPSENINDGFYTFRFSQPNFLAGRLYTTPNVLLRTINGDLQCHAKTAPRRNIGGSTVGQLCRSIALLEAKKNYARVELILTRSRTRSKP